MNEAETRAELIDPKLTASGWGVVPDSKVLREFHITAGKIQTGGLRAKPMIADYILVYKNRKIGVIEAKSDQQVVGEGVAQAKAYATPGNTVPPAPAARHRPGRRRSSRRAARRPAG